MPRSDRKPWSRFYWADWLTDPVVRSLTPEERGAYIDILAWSHQTDTPGVMTEEQARKWSGLTRYSWQRSHQALTRLFSVSGNIWTQKRAVQEAEEARKFHESAQVRGVLGANVRWRRG